MDHSLQPRPLFESRIRGLRKIHQGKVRDIYDVDADHLLIVTTDRLSAFDVVLPDPIPFKGQVLTKISEFWFEKTRALVPNHLTALRIEDIVRDPEERAQLAVLVDQRVAGYARVLRLYAKQAADRVRQKTGNHLNLRERGQWTARVRFLISRRPAETRNVRQTTGSSLPGKCTGASSQPAHDARNASTSVGRSVL